MFAMQGSLTAVLTNAWVKQNLGNSVSVWPCALKINSSWNSCRGRFPDHLGNGEVGLWGETKILVLCDCKNEN